MRAVYLFSAHTTIFIVTGYWKCVSVVCLFMSLYV